ncbi:MAG: dipeptidase PepV [Clostridia bacterium]|nr:dipeptidase PepV [Clostridia bacterium]
MLDNYINNLKDEIIRSTQELIKIPSVYNTSNNPSIPFGENVNKALEYTLELGKKLGFRTKNLDGFCGYIEFGEGEEVLGIIGHLDVVPEGEGWTFPPFSATISDGKIFGRGAIDDKGPVIASLYAMKAVMDNCKVHKRVRLILGLNEERNWKCIKHYKEVEEMPTFAFSPDADFPCIYAEKSILNCSIDMNYPENNNSKIKIKEVNCNNNALNVVPKFCSTILEIDSSKMSMDELIKFSKKIIDENNCEIDIHKISNDEVKLISHGVQAHGAHPDLGVNAISRLIIILDKIFKHYNTPIEILEYFDNYIGTDFSGKTLNIDFEDETGKLTLNVGRFSLENSKIKIEMNLRIPVQTLPNIINEKFLESINKYTNLNYNTISLAPALYVPKNNLLVKTLCDIFNKFTNQNCEPIAIGGGTYAKAFKNCVSFGANFPGHKDMCHQTDEYIEIDNLILCSKIYTEAIIALTSKNFKIQ